MFKINYESKIIDLAIIENEAQGVYYFVNDNLEVLETVEVDTMSFYPLEIIETYFKLIAENFITTSYNYKNQIEDVESFKHCRLYEECIDNQLRWQDIEEEPTTREELEAYIHNYIEMLKLKQ